MKTIILGVGKLLHVEAPGCIVNIRTGLTDSEGRSVTSVSILCDQYPGEPAWTMPDFQGGKTLHVRIRQSKKEDQELPA